MQKPKVEKAIARTHNVEFSPSLQRSNSAETFEKARNEQKEDWCK